MAVVRQIVKKRVGADGKEIDCKAESERWLDIKETKKAKYERGRGPAYQKTIYDHCTNSERRIYEDEPKITLKNPNNPGQKIEYLKAKGPNHGVIKKLSTEAGRGQYYQKTIIELCNNADNETRKVREQRVQNPTTGDHIQVERIINFKNDWGKGPAYQKKIVHLCNNEDEIKQSEGPCKFDGGS
jgi:hypothetical protein